jgi:acyl-coenzyme A synthetase/AMP-(fatty) acid ligase
MNPADLETTPEATPHTVRDWIDRAAARHPDKAYIVEADGGRRITYGEFQRLTRQVGTFLRQHGIGTNGRVALLCQNSIEHLACYFGVMGYGATICTIHVDMNRRHFDNIFARLKPDLIFYEAGLGLEDLVANASAPHFALGLWDKPQPEEFFGQVARCEPIDAYLASTGPSDDAVIFFTSGTDTLPKGVVLSCREHLGNIIPTAEGFGVTNDDRVYDFRSLNWASAQLLGALVPLSCGATLVLARKFSVSRCFQHIREHGATVAAGNPTTINMLLNSATDAYRSNLPSLRFITSSSAPLLLDEWRRFEERFGIPIMQGYGSSETGWIAAQSPDNCRFGTVGKPLAYHRLEIVDPAGQHLTAGQIGSVEIGCFAGNEYRYLAEDGSIKVNARERVRTGDRGFIDAEGYLHLTGRERELIIRGGVNISPLEIDSLLMQRTDLIEAATVGVPHEIYGEEIVCYVVPRPGAAIGAEELLRYCNAALPAFKAPKQIMFSRQLPKNERGKLDRKALVEQWRQDSLSPLAGENRASENRLSSFVPAQAGIQEPRPPNKE